MTIPSADLTTTHLDSPTDDPSQARVEILAAVNKLNALLADLGPGSSVWTSGNHGASSGLDSDLLDGQHGAFYLDGGNFTNLGALANRDTVGFAQMETSSIGESHILPDAVGQSEIASNSVGEAEIQSGAVTQLKIAANAVGSSQLASNAVTDGKIISQAVTQSKLFTSQSEISTTTNATLVLPGGEYGFYPRTRQSGNTAVQAKIVDSAVAISGSATTYIATSNMSGGTIYFQQRYINSSPPYNLGDGNIPIFVFVKVDANGKPISIYTADVPPWAYNGPTRVTADHITAHGEKFQFQTRVIDRDSGRIETVMVPVTHEIKNADMGLIPHPFDSKKPGESIILMDPPDTQHLKNLCDAGESINDLLHDDYLRIDNAALNRKSPNGVAAHKWKWKKTG